MAGKDQDKNPEQASSGDASDSEARLQDELSREASEGAESIGDVSSNRTLSGSSTWETLPDEASTSRESSTPKDRNRDKN